MHVVACVPFLSCLETCLFPNDFPDVYQEFMSGQFAAQPTENFRFSRIETDKVIEMTLNKDTETPGNHYVFNKEQV